MAVRGKINQEYSSFVAYTRGEEGALPRECHTVSKPILLYRFWGVSQMLIQKNRKKLKFVHVFMQI
jgi:hypothetical protein